MNILGALVGLGMIAVAVAGGIQYVKPSASRRAELAARMEAGFNALDVAYRAVRAGGLPAPATDGWEDALFPAGSAPPAGIAGLSWSYGNDAAGVWFCLSGVTTDAVVPEALSRLSSRLALGRYATAAECAGADASTDGRTAGTLWMRKAGE